MRRQSAGVLGGVLIMYKQARTVLVGAILLFVGSEVGAEVVTTDRRIRVTDRATNYKIVGVFERIGDGTVWLAPSDGGEPVEVPLTSETKLERSLGTKRHAGAGLVLGGFVGLAVGLALSSNIEEPNTVLLKDYKSSAEVGTIVLSVAIGALFGAAVGHSIEVERWTVIPVSELSLGLTTNRSGASISVTAEF